VDGGEKARHRKKLNLLKCKGMGQLGGSEESKTLEERQTRKTNTGMSEVEKERESLVDGGG